MAKKKGTKRTVTTTTTTKTVRTTNAGGRRFSDEEWPEFVLQGVIESAELKHDNLTITPELRAAIDRFEREAYDDLSDWITLHPLKGVQTIDDLWETTTPYDLLMTLNGAGVGIWDGRWDRYYSEADIEAYQKHLKRSKLAKAADESGGGWLNQAFEDAAYENANEGNPRGKKRGKKKASGRSKAKGGKRRSANPRERTLARRLAQGGE